ncbi:unnamed protein product [Lepeophtheirus salmonis]|uniref:(salmon louse) hypothetical protein n=1 Tax=Lepeophtheirus salmonis TaxID=72036 RepID=A0A0K2UFJ6_LEPSM|nr:unnamed protein product [Lepeophtheirus salmonis]CAF2921574.1 unnamed protein product [Lepeophtheirus salmonis]
MFRSLVVCALIAFSLGDNPQPAYKPAPQPAYKPAPQPSYKPAPQPSYKPAPQPSYKPAPQPSYKPAPQPSYKPAPYDESPKPYSFQYGVNDDYSGAKFSAQEDSDAKVISGSYQVALPDGRIQTVTYTVDGYSGYVADVQYEGTPTYPKYEPKPVSYKPAPAPYKPAPPQYKPAPAPYKPAPPQYKPAPAPYQPKPVPAYKPAPAPYTA